MKVKTGSNIDLEKNKSVDNSIMQKFGNIQDAETVLTVDGMFGYVVNDGIYINISGNVSKVASNNATQTDNISTYYQSNTPQPTDGLISVGTLWYNTSSRVLNIWTNTSWLPIGGDTSSPLVVWQSGESYVPNQMVLYTGNLYYNSTGNDISTASFNTSDWMILTESTTKQYTLRSTLLGGNTDGDLSLSSDSLSWSISHGLGKSFPNVVLVNATTNEVVQTTIIYNTNNLLTLRFSEPLSRLGYNLIVSIS